MEPGHVGVRLPTRETMKKNGVGADLAKAGTGEKYHMLSSMLVGARPSYVSCASGG